MAEKEKEKIVSREEIIGLVQLVIIFTAILAGREIGNIYGSYNELSKMAVNLNFSEEEMSNYLRDTIQGKNATLNVGLAVTIPGFTSTEGQVIQTPDYVRRWIISVTLSPIVVTQPEVSDVEVIFLIEGHQVLSKMYSFPRAKVGYISFLNRVIPLTVDDEAEFKKLVSDSAAAHSGEVEVTITGRAKANVLFFESMLPFKTTKYPLVSPPTLVLDKAEWSVWDSLGTRIPSLYPAKVGDRTGPEIVVSNPTRVHSITENTTLAVYLEGTPEAVFTQTKRVTAAAGTVSTYIFDFIPRSPGTYYFTLKSAGFNVTADTSPRLVVNP
jgi:hypothetical protein